MLRTVPALGYSRSSLRDGKIRINLCETTRPKRPRRILAPDEPPSFTSRQRTFLAFRALFHDAAKPLTVTN